MNKNGLYSTGGVNPTFNAKGKVWTDTGHFKEHVMYVLKDASLYKNCSVILTDTSVPKKIIIEVRPITNFFTESRGKFDPKDTPSTDKAIGNFADINRVINIMRDNTTLTKAAMDVLTNYAFDEPKFDTEARTVTTDITNPSTGKTYTIQIRFTYGGKIKAHCTCPATTYTN